MCVTGRDVKNKLNFVMFLGVFLVLFFSYAICVYSAFGYSFRMHVTGHDMRDERMFTQ